MLDSLFSLILAISVMNTGAPSTDKVVTSTVSKSNWHLISSDQDVVLETGKKKVVALGSTVIFWIKITNKNKNQEWTQSINRVFADCSSSDYILLQQIDYNGKLLVRRDDNPSNKMTLTEGGFLNEAIGFNCVTFPVPPELDSKDSIIDGGRVM